MIRMPLIAALPAILIATSAMAADPTADAIASLEARVRQLQQEVAVLRAVQNRDATSGNVTFTATGSRSDVTGGNRGDAVGASRSDTVGGHFKLQVGRSAAFEVGESRTDKVLGSYQLQIGDSQSVLAAHEIVINAGDRLTLKSGSSSIVMNKDGDITITGKNIQLQGSGDVFVKGAKIQPN